MVKRKLSDDLRILQETVGLQVPAAMEQFVQNLDFHRDKELLEVWECKCGKRYESVVPLLDAECPCGLTMKVIWRRSEQI